MSNTLWWDCFFQFRTIDRMRSCVQGLTQRVADGVKWIKFASKTQSASWPKCFWAKIKFCLKWSKRAQMGPKWSQTVKKVLCWSLGSIWDPYGPHHDIGTPAMFGNFWSKKGLFGTTHAHDWRVAIIKMLQINFVYVEGLFMCDGFPKLSPSPSSKS